MKAQRKQIIGGVAIFIAAILVVRITMQLREQEPVEDTEGWRRVLAFDATSTNKIHKADLGNHHILVAQHDYPDGWDINVYAYPVTEDSPNELYNGEDTRGPQPWHSFAWSKKKQLFPDIRIMDYGKAKYKLKIALRDCETVKDEKAVMLSAGRIEVFHNP